MYKVDSLSGFFSLYMLMACQITVIIADAYFAGWVSRTAVPATSGSLVRTIVGGAVWLVLTCWLIERLNRKWFDSDQ